ncbi:MAG: NAD(P)-dependent oxidoreductase [Geodermatophilaceae bacterium]|nr:NAD(P)-dependent oxidoreductase [Geodermatophilaceae bacterium]
MGDIGQVFGCLAGADAVVHLAAIPRPTFHPNEVVFRTNVLSTYNVLEVAAGLGIRRVVLASSISVLGFPFFYHRFAPNYVPLDEAHPMQPQDAYALSKVVGEVMADAFARRTEMTIVSLRLAWIHTPASFQEQLMPMWEDRAAGASNLWGYVDARDAARACRLALEADVKGHERFFIAAPDTFMPIRSEDLVREFYPEAELRPGFGEHASLFSSARASHLLAFRAEHRWRDYV